MLAKFSDVSSANPDQPPLLPATLHFLERGWLSSNGILLINDERTSLIDTGYFTHAQQTHQLIAPYLHDRPLDHVYNTHLHSDHCGGNAYLQSLYPSLRIHIPTPSLQAVSEWNEKALTFEATGQTCPSFTHHGGLHDLSSFEAGGLTWLVRQAPGHDPDSVILFNEEFRILISADALWENGFGVVFPELEGETAFDAVAETLQLIESLAPRIVLPGHGALFTDVEGSLRVARARLKGFQQSPIKHANYATKVLIKFKLLELQHITLDSFFQWADDTPYFHVLHASYWSDMTFIAWLMQFLDELAKGKALSIQDEWLTNL